MHCIFISSTLDLYHGYAALLHVGYQHIIHMRCLSEQLR